MTAHPGPAAWAGDLFPDFVDPTMEPTPGEWDGGLFDEFVNAPGDWPPGTPAGRWRRDGLAHQVTVAYVTAAAEPERFEFEVLLAGRSEITGQPVYARGSDRTLAGAQAAAEYVSAKCARPG